MTIAQQNLLLTDILRPTSFDDLTLSDNQINAFRKMYDKDNLMNMIFYGRPGVGKTSAALLFAKDRYFSTLHINGAELNKGGYEDMLISASSIVFDGYIKRIIIDEADTVSEKLQDRLRYDIEEKSKSCRFILTTNELSQLSDAIRSRCFPISFDPSHKDKDHIIKRLESRIASKLEAYKVSDEAISKAVHDHFPDMRKIANAIQFSSVI